MNLYGSMHESILSTDALFCLDFVEIASLAKY